MEYFVIGEIMRKARLRHGLTQEELSYGICSVSTLSRIENGVSEPRGSTFEMLMRRMGEPGSRYVFFAGEKNMQRRRLLRRMERSIRFREGNKIRDLLEQYRGIPGEEEAPDAQGRMLAEAALMLTGRTAPKEVHTRLQEALDLTCPDLRKYWRQEPLFTRRELLAFQLIAYCCQQEGQFGKAALLLEWILGYQQMNLSEEDMIEDVEPSVCVQLAELYVLMRQLPDSRRVCERGIRCCIRTEKCHFLLILLALKARIMAEIGDAQESRVAEDHAFLLREIVTNQNYLSEFEILDDPVPYWLEPDIII